MRTVPVLLLAACLASQAAAQGAAKPDTPSITVRGEASAEVVPDTVVVVFGVVTERPSAAEAMAQNSKALAEAIALVKAEGVTPEDIATTNAGLTPQTSSPDKGRPRIVGYRAENQLQVRLKPADRAGAILAKIVDAGVNDVETVSPVVSDDKTVRDKLRALAADNARHQAEIYASALGVTLGPVLVIDPELANPVPRFAMAAKDARASAPVPVEVGQQTISESVRVTFALRQP